MKRIEYADNKISIMTIAEIREMRCPQDFGICGDCTDCQNADEQEKCNACWESEDIRSFTS